MWTIIGCAVVGLAITIVLIASGSFADPVEKIEEQIEQGDYSEVVEIYDEKIVKTDHEEEYRATLLGIIVDTFAAWVALIPVCLAVIIMMQMAISGVLACPGCSGVRTPLPNRGP